MAQFHYTAEDIRRLITEDLRRRLDDDTINNLPFFSDGLNGYHVSVPEPFEEESAVEDSETLQIISVGEPPVLNRTESTTASPSSPPQPEPPVPESDYRAGIEELLEWAIEHQRMVQIVYLKRVGGDFERSARIITPLSVEDDRIRTILHVTMRDSTEPEYTNASDNRRTFITGLIEKAKIITNI